MHPPWPIHATWNRRSTAPPHAMRLGSSSARSGQDHRCCRPACPFAIVGPPGGSCDSIESKGPLNATRPESSPVDFSTPRLVGTSVHGGQRALDPLKSSPNPPTGRDVLTLFTPFPAKPEWRPPQSLAATGTAAQVAVKVDAGVGVGGFRSTPNDFEGSDDFIPRRLVDKPGAHLLVLDHSGWRANRLRPASRRRHTRLTMPHRGN